MLCDKCADGNVTVYEKTRFFCENLVCYIFDKYMYLYYYKTNLLPSLRPVMCFAFQIKHFLCSCATNIKKLRNVFGYEDDKN